MALTWKAVDFGGPEVLRVFETDVPSPGPGEVTVDVRAVGMNPADHKHIAAGQDRSLLPLSLGYEVAGVVSAVGPDPQPAHGPRVGEEVIAFQVSGGYATSLTVRASDVFAKPAGLEFPQAANLLLVGSTAAELLHVSGVGPDDVILLHGAAGSVGLSALQQARLLGARVIGTAGPASFARVRRFGGEPVEYGPGLLERVRTLAPGGVGVALDTVGSAEAGDVSLALVPDRRRIVTTVDFARAAADGFASIGSANPASAPYRAGVRRRLVGLAAEGRLAVPLARTVPFEQAPAALALLLSGHANGKLALLVDAGSPPDVHPDREGLS